jgi:hypothetical protein
MITGTIPVKTGKLRRNAASAAELKMGVATALAATMTTGRRDGVPRPLADQVAR